MVAIRLLLAHRPGRSTNRLVCGSLKGLMSLTQLGWRIWEDRTIFDVFSYFPWIHFSVLLDESSIARNLTEGPTWCSKTQILYMNKNRASIPTLITILPSREKALYWRGMVSTVDNRLAKRCLGSMVILLSI